MKMVGNAFLFQVIFFLIALGSLASKDSATTQYFWLIGRYCLITSAICYLCMIYFGLVVHRAFFCTPLLFNVCTFMDSSIDDGRV